MAPRSSSAWPIPTEPPSCRKTTALTAGSSPAFFIRSSSSRSEVPPIAPKENVSSGGSSVTSPARRNTAILGLGGAGFAPSFSPLAGVPFAWPAGSSPRTRTAGHTARFANRPATIASRNALPRCIVMILLLVFGPELKSPAATRTAPV